VAGVLQRQPPHSKQAQGASLCTLDGSGRLQCSWTTAGQGSSGRGHCHATMTISIAIRGPAVAFPPNKFNLSVVWITPLSETQKQCIWNRRRHFSLCLPPCSGPRHTGHCSQICSQLTRAVRSTKTPSIKNGTRNVALQLRGPPSSLATTIAKKENNRSRSPSHFLRTRQTSQRLAKRHVPRSTGALCWRCAGQQPSNMSATACILCWVTRWDMPSQTVKKTS